MDSITQAAEEVKCAYDGCGEEVYRDGLCWGHFITEKLADWDAQDAERETCLEGTGRTLGGGRQEVCR